MTPQAGRLLTLGSSLLLAGLLLGRLELVALAAPFLVLLAAALCRRGARVEVDLLTRAERILEGERTEVTVAVTARDGAVDQANLEILLSAGLRLVAGSVRMTVALARDERRLLTVTVEPQRWGVHRVGPALVSAYSRGRLAATAARADPVPLRVLPRAERFRAGTSHPFTRAVTGSHVSSGAGEGIEFAGIRPFRPGDQLRRINWPVSARYGQIHVTEHRPERNADVVLFLDTFVDVGPTDRTTLDVAVRAALGVAEHYLKQMDRVGVVGFGGVVRWLTATSGALGFYRVVEHLLGTQTVLSYAWKDLAVLPAGALPPRALVIALSPLLDQRAVGALADLARRGFGVVGVDVSPEPLLPLPTSPAAALAQRIWLLERGSLLHRLSEIGVPVVRWTGSGALDAVLSEVARLHARPRLVQR